MHQDSVYCMISGGRFGMSPAWCWWCSVSLPHAYAQPVQSKELRPFTTTPCVGTEFYLTMDNEVNGAETLQQHGYPR